MVIAEYNKGLGKNVPLIPLQGCDQTLNHTKICGQKSTETNNLEFRA